MQACAAYGIGCITNLAGCVEATDPCDTYKGTRAICNGFIGINMPCTNVQYANSNDYCIPRTCVLNTTASSNADCTAWYPQTNGIVNCVWGGTLGCVPPQNCAAFIGTVDSCPTFIAQDGPCSGTGSVPAPKPCIINNYICFDAPKKYNTDAQCKSWGQLCMTNGNVCTSKYELTCQSIQTNDACLIYSSFPRFYCSLAQQCKIRPSFCGIIITAFECNNTPLTGSDKQICGWNGLTSLCVQLNCQLLPVTLTTKLQCSASISTCTTNRAGCITKDACSELTDNASEQLQQNTSICRLKQCTDSLLTQSTQCKQEIPGVKCVSNGTNCIPLSTCSSYTAREACSGGGSDGVCAFIPGANITTPNIGTCSLFTQCSIPNSDQIACNSRSDACYFNQTTINGTTTSQCIPHTCATKAQGTSCQHIPSWDLSQYQICVLSGKTCTQGNPNQLTSQNCYNNSVGTQSWNINTSSCIAYIKKNSTNNTEVIDNLNNQLVRVCLLVILII